MRGSAMLCHIPGFGRVAMAREARISRGCSWLQSSTNPLAARHTQLLADIMLHVFVTSLSGISRFPSLQQFRVASELRACPLAPRLSRTHQLELVLTCHAALSLHTGQLEGHSLADCQGLEARLGTRGPDRQRSFQAGGEQPDLAGRGVWCTLSSKCASCHHMCFLPASMLASIEHVFVLP